MKKKIIQFRLQQKNKVNLLVNPVEIPVTTKRNKLLKFVNNKQGKINMLSQVMNVTTDKKTTLLPILNLSSFKKKGKKDDT